MLIQSAALPLGLGEVLDNYISNNPPFPALRVIILLVPVGSFFSEWVPFTLVSKGNSGTKDLAGSSDLNRLASPASEVFSTRLNTIFTPWVPPYHERANLPTPSPTVTAQRCHGSMVPSPGHPILGADTLTQ